MQRPDELFGAWDGTAADFDRLADLLLSISLLRFEV